MYIKKLTIWLFMLLALSACSDVKDALGIDDTPKVPSEGVVLTLKLPTFTKHSISTRADGGETLSKLAVLCYDSDGKYLGKTQPSGSDITVKDAASGTYSAKVKVLPNTSDIHVVTNTDVTSTEAGDLFSAMRSGNISTSEPVCWGSISVSDLLGGNAKLSLLRMFAKVSVTKDSSVDNFEITGFKLYKTANSGTIASKSLDEVADASVGCTTTTADFTTGEVPCYETPAKNAYVIIRGKYNGGKESYYKVMFLQNGATTNDDQVSLLRNHHYQIRVTGVNHDGWATEGLAEVNDYENRMLTEVVDDNPPIVEMKACRDYELGVCGTQTVLGKGGTAKVTFVTTKPDFTWDIACNADWVTVNKNPIEEVSLPLSAGADSCTLSSVGKLYTLQITLKENYNSNQRPATLTVTSGDLSLDIVVTQLGYDFRTDDSRKVQIRGLAGLTSADEADYFKWMDSSLQGISAAANQGQVRNDGLHFFVGNNPVYYLIPKLSGDKLTCKDSRVKVDDNYSESGKSYYKVTLANNSAESYDSNNYNLWVSKEAFNIITITNSNNEISITYPVYHVGLFSKLDGRAVDDYQMGTEKKSGWYYYEMVDVKGASKTYHMFDRNIGASTDAYYSPATTDLRPDSVARGGYFKISVVENSEDAKTNNDVVNALAIGSFKVCSQSFLQDLIDCGTLNVVEKSTAYGEKYNCIQIKTTGNSKHEYIYIPMSGYYESQQLRNPYHANLWSCSRLAGYQGFSNESLEYGFWYVYLDVYGRQIDLSNFRFVSGSSGENTGRYRGLPVRLAVE